LFAVCADLFEIEENNNADIAGDESDARFDAAAGHVFVTLRRSKPH